MRRLARSTVAAAAVALPALGATPERSQTLDRSSVEREDYRVAQWTTQQGLPQNTVNDMVFLPGGDLWLATFGGLARFDGHTFRVLDMAADEGLPANRIVALAGAGADSFLFLTQQGHLGRVEAGRSTLRVPPPSPSIDALDLVVDRSGRAFLKAIDGSVWHTDGHHAWQAVLGPARGGATYDDLALDEDGGAWVVWGDELVQVQGGRPGARVTLPGPGAVAAARPGGGFWIGLPDGIASVVRGRVRRLEIEPPLDGRVSAIALDRAGALWVAAARQVSRLERGGDGTWRRTPLPLQLSPAISVPTLRLDAQGTLWIGTGAGGLLRVNRLPTRRHGAAFGLEGVGALAADGRGGVVLASGCRALYHLSGDGDARPILLPEPDPGLPEPPCGTSLAPAPSDTLWVRTGQRLFRLRDRDARLVAEGLPPVQGPLVANADGSLWVVSRSGRLDLLSAEGKPMRRIDLEPPLVSASLGPDGTLWVGGDGELIRIGPRGPERISREAQMPRGQVRDVRVDPDGTVWIGTYGGGVGRLRGGRVARITVAQGLPDNSVSRILDDGRGRLWISTNRGIAVIARAELEAVADGRVAAIEPVVLGIERGVPEANFGSPAGFVEAGGRLWFGTIEGAVSIDAAAFPLDTTPPAVRIEEVRAADRALPLGATVRIPPLTPRLRVSYTAPSLLYPERMRFRFRVEGVDPGWVQAGSERTVDWSPPGPGRYRFLVEARNEDGVWSSEPAVVVLDVRPAWWQATAFRVVAGLAATLLAAAAVRQRIRGIQRRHAERLRVLEEQRRAEARVADLRAQLEHVSRAALAGELAAGLAHEVRQPIGAIVNNAEAGRRNLPRYLARPEELEQILRDIVADAMRASEVVQGLRGFLGPGGGEATPVDLSALVREMLPLVRRELEDSRVEVDLDLAEALPPVEGSRVQLGQVVVNLVVNACEALSGREGERRVEIGTAARDGRVELGVRDNGPGLDPTVAERIFEPFVTTKPDGLGVGLALCRSIAERHGGRLTAASPPGGGLAMTLSLPAAGPTGDRP